MNDHDPGTSVDGETDAHAQEASMDWDAAYAGDVPETPVDADLMAIASGLSPGTALDLGCGSGQNCMWLARQGWQVLGVDIAPKAIARARLSAAKADVAATFEVADIADWRPEQEYDLVTSTYALPPVGRGRDQALAMAARAVAPGGTILIADFDESLAEQGWMSKENLVTVEDLSAAVERFEVRIAEVRVIGHAHGERSRELPVACVVARRPHLDSAHVSADLPSFGERSAHRVIDHRARGCHPAWPSAAAHHEPPPRPPTRARPHSTR